MEETPERSWLDLPTTLLELVFSKLSLPDILRSKLVCSSWCDAAKSFDLAPQPFLVLPSSQKGEERSLQFFIARDDFKKVVYTANNNLEKLLDGGFCGGSSQGWLVFLDKYANPWLINLFTGKEIELPKRETFPHIDTIEAIPPGIIDNIKQTPPDYYVADENIEEEYLTVKFRPEHREIPHQSGVLGLKFFQRTLIRKAILSANPCYDKNYRIIVIYDLEKLAFCDPGDPKWTALSNSYYHDAVWHDNMLYALNGGTSIEVWDLNDSPPTKTMTVPIPRTINPPDIGVQFYRRYSYQYYLAPCMGDFLVIQRCLEDVNVGDYLSEEDVSDMEISSSRTVTFKIYKLDLTEETLLKVKSLQAQALFLGGNQTISVCSKDFEGLRSNSVYFSDHYYCYSHRGHDIGIFNLEDGSIEKLTDVKKFEPTPFWVVPL